MHAQSKMSLEVKPDQLITVFAGVDKDAVDAVINTCSFSSNHRQVWLCSKIEH
jgi:putative YphP/YqiW family bacilliredoxin